VDTGGAPITATSNVYGVWDSASGRVVDGPWPDLTDSSDDDTGGVPTTTTVRYLDDARVIPPLRVRCALVRPFSTPRARLILLDTPRPDLRALVLPIRVWPSGLPTNGHPHLNFYDAMAASVSVGALDARYADLTTLFAGADEVPPLIDVTPVEFDYDLSWSRWLADADAWLGDSGHRISDSTWLGHILALWASPRRIDIAVQALTYLSCDTTARSRRVGPVLHFIAASYWANPRPDGRLHLGDAYRHATDLTTHAILTSRVVKYGVAASGGLPR
jgi:hypothetical protein